MKLLKIASLAATILLSAGSIASAQEQLVLKFSNWLPAAHPVSKFIDRWAAEIGEKSNGRIKVETFHSGQLFPVTESYDAVRRGTVDMAFILHGVQSDRFPLTGLIDIPFLVDNSVQGTRLVNDPELRAKYFDPEHRGVKVLMLMTNQPAQIITVDKKVGNPADLKGLRIRFPTAVAKAWLDQMGATSVGLPPSAIAENVQKHVIDGLMIDYGGAGVAYKLGGMIANVTELNAYVSSFGIVINPDSYARIPDDLKPIFDASWVGREQEVGEGWDSLNAPGKAALIDGGATVVVPEGADRAAFEDAAAAVRTSVLAARDAAGVPASEAYARMQAIAAVLKGR